jgi:hypothetical protein
MRWNRDRRTRRRADVGVERFTELRLGQGMHRVLTGELAAVARAYPLRERPTEFLMTAMERSGRRAEALRSFTRCAGISRTSSASIRERRAESAGTRGCCDSRGRTIRPPSRAGRSRHSAPDVSRIAGRAADLRHMEQLVAEGRDVPCGDRPPGVGKTALAIRFAHSMAAGRPDGQLFVNLGGLGTGGPVDSLDAIGVFCGRWEHRRIGCPPTSPRQAPSCAPP